MCAQFILRKNIQELQKIFGLPLLTNAIYNERILPHSRAVVVKEEGITVMNFSLTPSWSHEAKVKYATYNARLETVAEKSTWKTPFLRSHCFVPMYAFIEPIYEGDLAGNMVSFNSENLMYAAGIYDTWIDKKTGEALESFAIITSDPSPFVKSIGHDRQPLFLDLASATRWNSLKGSAKDLKEFLTQHSLTPSLKTCVDRVIKSYKKKQDDNLSLF